MNESAFALDLFAIDTFDFQRRVIATLRCRKNLHRRQHRCWLVVAQLFLPLLVIRIVLQ